MLFERCICSHDGLAKRSVNLPCSLRLQTDAGPCLGPGDTILMVQKVGNSLSKMGNIMPVSGNKKLETANAELYFS